MLDLLGDCTTLRMRARPTAEFTSIVDEHTLQHRPTAAAPPRYRHLAGMELGEANSAAHIDEDLRVDSTDTLERTDEAGAPAVEIAERGDLSANL